MANLIPLAVADFETQLSTALEVGDVAFSITTATDDDGVALPAGKYCFTVDNGKSNKEYLLGQLNGTDVTSVVRVSRQGVETSGTGYAHRIGANTVITDFATIQRVADILRGQIDLDGSNPVGYDAEPSLADRKDLATVGYVLDTVTGGTVAFDTQTVTGSAGEAVAAGDLVYFKTSDQEWYLTDADTAATVEGVLLGIALGSGTDGVAITGGVLTNGLYTTTGLTAGSEYYASNTAGAYSTSAGTTSRKIGLALSTTRLYFYATNPTDINASTTAQGVVEEATQAEVYAETAIGGTGARLFVNPSTLTHINYQEFISSGTWTKPTKGTTVFVQGWGAGGAGGRGSSIAGGGGGGAYVEAWFDIDDLAGTETVTIGAGGIGTTGNGGIGGNTTFGSLLTAYGGGGGAGVNNSGGGGGGGSLTAGSSSTGDNGGAGGRPLSGAAGTTSNHGGDSAYGGGGGGAETSRLGGWSHMGGGGGGGYTVAGGNSVYGGGGGGGAAGGAAGTSVYGGDGGVGSDTAGAAGAVPGGGGGAGRTGNGGDGGAGKVIVTVF